ncbi:hypothetical protein TSUD_293420 [Trifolium subterraneum]|uniref:Protein kinase domain-containing protein n=1 Tax=Trifolium subterraneum TaxID=3900 RepID=A0A2Z6MYT7_TRISU|nr:hypothetical protein TSUD_293420 [Trifolium subterraneum]
MLPRKLSQSQSSISSSSPPPPHHHHHILIPLLAGTTVVLTLLLIFTFLRRRTRKKRTSPFSATDNDPPHRFSYSLLRRATNSFSNPLGHGGFGTVYSGTLSSKPIAVKLMDTSSHQGEREFHNELFFASKLCSLYIIPPDDEMKKRNENDDLECGGVQVVIDDCGSMESVHNSFFEEGGNLGVEQSSVASPETVEMRMTITMALAASPCFDKGSVKSEKDVVGVEDGKRIGKGLTSNLVRDWWWKQDNEVAGLTPVGEGKKVKDYVMDWIGREVKSEKGELAGVKMGKREMKKEKKNRKQKLEWWESMDEENVGGVVKKDKRKSVREWWKEEYCEEVAKEKKKKRKHKKMKKGVENDDDISNDDTWWMSDDALYVDKKKEKRRSRNNRGSGDWWLDGFSGDLWRARRNSFDSTSGDIPKSGGVSSTPSMRGTICYVAPECGYGDDVSEKCDVYSFGILLLVIISGRRPLQVTGSPLSEFQRANLLSWARHCARNGKLIELVDESIQSLNKDQALICIKVALLCLLKSPVRRPSMKEVVGMLSGELETPQLPVEYSPSTPSRFPFKSRKKGQGRQVG